MKVESITDSNGNDVSSNPNHLANLNPLRYRSYFYDTETGFYWLNTRYYDPAIGRFINADGATAGVSGTVIGYNLFAYCFNNPINLFDKNGSWPDWNKVLEGTLLATIGILTVAAVISSGGTCAPLVAAAYSVVGTSGVIATAVGASEVVEGFTESNPIKEEIGDYNYNTLKNGSLAVISLSPIVLPLGSSLSVCFVAGTEVAAEFGLTAIENIKEGDYVWATDPDTGETELKRVVQTFVNQTNELLHITVNGEEIVTTPEHPFYVPGKGWTSAICLRAGDMLVMLNGEYAIVERIQHEILESPITVYNFEVEDFHSYYVGKSSILVHNDCGEWKTIIESKNAYKTVKKFDEVQTKMYELALQKLANGNYDGLHLHYPSNGYLAADIHGFGKGRGNGRILYQIFEGIIEISEDNIKHYKK